MEPGKAVRGSFGCFKGVHMEGIWDPVLVEIGGLEWAQIEGWERTPG